MRTGRGRVGGARGTEHRSTERGPGSQSVCTPCTVDVIRSHSRRSDSGEKARGASLFALCVFASVRQCSCASRTRSGRFCALAGKNLVITRKKAKSRPQRTRGVASSTPKSLRSPPLLSSLLSSLLSAPTPHVAKKTVFIPALKSPEPAAQSVRPPSSKAPPALPPIPPRRPHPP